MNLIPLEGPYYIVNGNYWNIEGGICVCVCVHMYALKTQVQIWTFILARDAQNLRLTCTCMNRVWLELSVELTATFWGNNFIPLCMLIYNYAYIHTHM